MHKYAYFVMTLIVGVMTSSCNGIFSWIYDPVPEKILYGFIETNNNSGTIFIDATAYDKWTYISLSNETIDTVNANNVDFEPINWDFAVHRYDVKTNGGAVAETDCTSIEEVVNGNFSMIGDFVEDEMSQVAVDMSGMMDNNIVYVDSYLNPLLCSWLDVNTSQMPPIYTMSGKVYLLQLSNGQYAALQFVNYLNASGVKGYITIKYAYPVNVNS